MAVTERYWHANCQGLDIDFITTGEHKPESLDVHEFPFSCPVCGGDHVALEVSKTERNILKTQSPGDGELTPQIVENLEEDFAETVGDDVLNIDVIHVFIDEYAFDTVASNCSWCDADVEIGSSAYLWGEPAPGGKFVSIKTYDKEECLKADLERYREQQGKDAMLIKFRA